MEKHIKFLTAGLLIAMLISACGPVTTPPPAQPESLPQQGDSAPAAEPANTDEPAAASSDAPTEAQNDEPPMAVPTSRGDQLEATDPSTVMLASGGLQLVEFFRFTWGTCRSMAPMVHGLEAKYHDKIAFSFLDADDPNTSDFQSALGFRYQPEFYLLDGDGNMLKKWVGLVSQEDFEAAFAEYLQ